MSDVIGPFGPARQVASMSSDHIKAMYRHKCGVEIDMSAATDGLVQLFECQATGYRFWRPIELAGDEEFYQKLDLNWPNYYQRRRWEYSFALSAIKGCSSFLEIGCGRGFFLRSTEGHVTQAHGLEFNKDAIKNKVTNWDISHKTIEELAEKQSSAFDAISAFQVLEHVIDPNEFLRACLNALRPGGQLIMSTPNPNYVPHQLRQDAFDLPPHHMGQFSHDTYRRLAQHLGLDIVAIHVQPRTARGEDVNLATKRSAVYKIARAIGYLPMNIAYWLNEEPGPNILAIFRKPE
ncbi:class I SAM-dependent methyltransferase [Rhizorhapis sp. SPR117]|uniref:class I SAM-dependent methyltransferase n=1 Tax=Rhizorhapis sp. SPR117 TaxID=2912611 RepID=UPI001F2E755A|nr:class I SAM-dependent methyltransferase [Rhizorhapis sp. SPR117]